MRHQAFYPIVDASLCRARGVAPLALAEACLRGGARWLQLRAKDETGAALLALADALVAAARAAGAQVIVNDRIDIAVMSGAHGVHLGQDDLPVDLARAVAGPDAVIGLSTHDAAQVEEALATTASYVAVGPIFATSTKDTGYQPVGLDLVRRAAGRGKPIVAIGGITLDNAAEVVAAGATAVAVISDIVARDPEERVRRFVRALA